MTIEKLQQSHVATIGLLGLLAILSNTACDIEQGMQDFQDEIDRSGEIDLFKNTSTGEAIFQQDGGSYNMLVYLTIAEGIGNPPVGCPPSQEEMDEWTKKAVQYWKKTWYGIMEQHLKAGHPSAILWDKTGRKLVLGEL